MGVKRTMTWVTACFVISMGFLWQGLAWGQEVCKPTTADSIQVKLQYLRRLSIDLRGHLPSPEEAQEVIRTGELPKTTLTKWLQEENLYAQLKTYHKDLLWANMSTLDFKNDWRINKGDGDKEPFWSTYTSDQRGGEIGCLDQPAESDGNGGYKTTPDDTDPKMKREGYLKVKPYWAPSTEIKVCAFDATHCGENLRHCQSDSAKTAQMFTDALIEQTLQYADQIVRSGKPYTQLIQGQSALFNGPVSHLMRYQTHTVDGIKVEDVYKTVPVIEFQDDKWRNVDVSVRHSGILTMPLYLIKYTSNRSRASQFYDKILCKPFQAPPGGLPPGNDSCHNEPNLMKRCGCKYCHQTLEPAAAYWGRWLQTSLTFLDPEKYPAFKPECATSNPDRNKCGLYTTKPSHVDQESYKGYLSSYMFSTERMKKNIELGPIGIAKEAIETKTFARCTTNKMWDWFVGSPQPSPELMASLAEGFEKNKYDLRKLLEAIVSHPAYGQGRLYHIAYNK